MVESGEETPCSKKEEGLVPSSNEDQQLKPCRSKEPQVKPCSSEKPQMKPCSSKEPQMKPCSSEEPQIKSSNNKLVRKNYCIKYENNNSKRWDGKTDGEWLHSVCNKSEIHCGDKVKLPWTAKKGNIQ